jgi:hypothetical protein
MAHRSRCNGQGKGPGPALHKVLISKWLRGVVVGGIVCGKLAESFVEPLRAGAERFARSGSEFVVREGLAISSKVFRLVRK